MFIKPLLSASTVLGAGSTAMNKAEESLSVTKFPQGAAREGTAEEVPSELTSESWKGVNPGEHTWKRFPARGTRTPPPKKNSFERSISSMHFRKRKEFHELFLRSSHLPVKGTCSC